MIRKKHPKENKSKYKEFFKDVGWVILACIPGFIYGALQGIFGWEPQKIISLIIAFSVWGVLLSKRPYASLYWGILNINIIMIAISAYEIYKKRTNA